MHRRSISTARSFAAKLTHVGLVGLVIIALSTLALPASAAGNQVNVYPDDLSSTNVSSERTGWDATGVSKFTGLPTPGTKWALDIENKPPGSASIDANGLTLSVTDDPITKVRYQYYVGTGGYPAVDALAPTLADVFAAPLGWDQTLVSGNATFGVGLQIQLEKEISAGVYDRVTVTNTADPGTGSRDFLTANWFANSDIYTDGYLAGTVANQKYLTTGVAKDLLLTNFGDFTVVSFGPNLGRDYAYDYRIQDFTILDQTFHFIEGDTDTTPVTVVVPRGFLAMTVPAGATLSTGVPDADSTVVLAATVVTDERRDVLNWTASVSLPELTGSTTSETIPTTGATYTAATVTKTGTSTVTPTAITGLTAATTSRAATGVHGENTSSWTATLTVPIPANVLADTYSGTMTQSVL